MKYLYLTLSIILFVPYFGAYCISKLLGIDEYNNIQTPGEWFSIYKEVEEC